MDDKLHIHEGAHIKSKVETPDPSAIWPAIKIAAVSRMCLAEGHGALIRSRLNGLHQSRMRRDEGQSPCVERQWRMLGRCGSESSLLPQMTWSREAWRRSCPSWRVGMEGSVPSSLSRTRCRISSYLRPYTEITVTR